MKNIKEDFPLLKNNDLIYLDNAATTQKPNIVIDAVNKFYKEENSNIHRGAYTLSMNTTLKYEETRTKISKFINARYSEEIIYTRNATEGLNLLAYSYGMENVNKDDEIVLSIMEHHSNLVPWQNVAMKKQAKLNYMYLNDKYEISDEEIETKITDKTKIVTIAHVSNVLGTINNIEKIIKYAHKKGAIVIVDASQSIQHIKIDVQKLDADFLVFSGHKMYGPLGIGILYGKKELLNKMNPFLMGGDMIEYVYEDKTTYAPLPNKFEAGTQNIEGVIGLGAAIDYINDLGFEYIQEKEKELITYARNELLKLDFLKLYLPEENNHSSVISFNIKGIHPHDIASVLDTLNICIRSGNHCAQPLMRYIGIDSTCRLSICFYNTKEDIDKLIEGLNKAYDMFKKYMKV